MDGVVIAWTPTNWITIFLMALGGLLIVKLGVMGVKAVANRGAVNA